MQTLKGKKAVITGAGKGLGKAMALALAAEGVELALLGRSSQNLQQVAEETQQINPDLKTKTYVADVSDYTQVREQVKAILADFGGVDILINNAGVFLAAGILEVDVAEWENVFKTNMFGSFYMIKEIIPGMMERKSGDIINIASTAGLKGSAKLNAYGASKAALINFSEGLMQEARKSNIRVTTVNPSTITTDMTLNAKLTDGNTEKVLQPDDLATIVVHNLKLPARAFVKDFALWSTNP